MEEDREPWLERGIGLGRERRSSWMARLGGSRRLGELGDLSGRGMRRQALWHRLSHAYPVKDLDHFYHTLEIAWRPFRRENQTKGRERRGWSAGVFF